MSLRGCDWNPGQSARDLGPCTRDRPATEPFCPHQATRAPWLSLTCYYHSRGEPSLRDIPLGTGLEGSACNQGLLAPLWPGELSVYPSLNCFTMSSHSGIPTISSNVFRSTASSSTIGLPAFRTASPRSIALVN